MFAQRVMNPREEKSRDLANQCKNRWGNSDKAARKGIRRFKRGSNRRSRRLDKIQMGQNASPDGEAHSPPPPVYRQKLSDTPMAEILLRKSWKRMRQVLPPGADEVFIDSFERHCMAKGIPRPKANGWARFLRGELTIGVIPIPIMTLEDSIELEGVLRDFILSRGARGEQADASKRAERDV